MDFSYSQEQHSLRELAARQLGERFTDDFRKQFARSGQPYDTMLWARLAQAGLLGTPVGVQAGGSGLGLTELALLLEEQGRTLAALPLLPTLVMGALPLQKFGSPGQQALLPGVVSGEVLLTAALEEPSGSDPAHPATQATALEGGWRLCGEKICVPYGAQAQLLLVPAGSEDGVRMFLIEPGSAGLRIEPQICTSGEPQARLILSQVRATPAQVLGDVASEVVSWTLERAQVAYAAEQLGVLQESLRRAAAYVSERRQFGRPIGSFQAVQHRLADCYIDLEALRSVYLRAVWALDNGVAAGAEALAAKWWTARAGHRVSHAVQHVHGGLGADVEYPIHAFFLRATQLGIALGGSKPVLARIGARLAAGSVAPFT
jgi:alkylation response protein AidB-like acyl-CoA dehydrogenase